ncbi:hypothetical protein ACPTIC_23265 [Pseudomonas aeruginosa]|uniref:hypothetical protein n=1 Tax=Pseudomonas aeruginosa TaxID=287 RepID=UPI003CC5CC60
MLIVRLEQGWTLKLDRQVGSSGKHGIWSFHCAESTYTPAPAELLRHAAILPAEPKDGQKVAVAICDTRMPQDEWRPVGNGVATYEAER